MNKAAVLATALITMPLAAEAQGTFSAPEGCTGFLTVHMRSCEVANYWTCEADAPGEKWRVDIGETGPVFASKTDFEGQWIESIGLRSGSRDVLVSSEDPASFTELSEVGIDTFDFITRSDDGVDQRYVGFDQLTGDEVEIDGEPLLPTEYSVRATDDGEPRYVSTGSQYISLRHRLFFAGTDTTVYTDETYENDQTPVAFVYPGEPGFFPNRPSFGCGAEDARFDR